MRLRNIATFVCLKISELAAQCAFKLQAESSKLETALMSNRSESDYQSNGSEVITGIAMTPKAVAMRVDLVRPELVQKEQVKPLKGSVEERIERIRRQ